MITQLVKAVLGTSSERKLRELRRKLPAISVLEPQMQALSDEVLQAKTAEFRERLAKGETLDSLLIEVAAVIREASKRVLGMRPFDVQLLGGMVLNDGRIAEMKTGEGKTLVAAMPVYLNALSGKGVHVVTVNDYLAARDAATIGKLYQFMGMSVGVIVHDMDDSARKAAYAADITYGTNNEFGFDYLRDNMKFSLEEMVQREFNYAIIDEVDSILIDEARTPLIISGPSDDSSELYRKVNEIVKVLVVHPETYEKDDKLKIVHLTEHGNEKIEEMLRRENILTSGSLYDYNNIPVVHHVQQSLRAHTLFTKDVDYIVRDGKVTIIDEFTGRMMEGRRFSEGLHQALEAKEYTEIQPENHTLASITYQNYFRLYPKLSGMTGTAATEADEFSEIYDLDVVEIPTNRPVLRDDQNDAVYRTASEKYAAIIELVKEVHARKQPVLIGTTSIEKSELLSDLLNKHKIKHNVLNARFHEKEAEIISQAGAPGSVTIATNMAGRGTDIKLGGNVDMRVKVETALVSDPTEKILIEEDIRRSFEINQKIVLDAGGLYVIGTERHESRRIDNQLRGRSGRQGDPGASRFFLSLEDDLMRIFGSDKMGSMLQKLGLKEGEAIVHPWINKALEKAQAKVEARNFDMRKNLLKYDDVMNDQRKEIYAQRRDFMKSDNVSAVVAEMLEEVVTLLVDQHLPEKSFPEQWDLSGLESDVARVLNLDLSLEEWRNERGVTVELVIDSLIQFSKEAMQEKLAKQSDKIISFVEKSVLLQVLDEVWKEHLMALDYLRQGIGLRAYGQKDPLNEYKREAFDLFNTMLDELKTRIIYVLSHMNFELPTEGISVLPISESVPEQTIFETFQPEPLSEPVTLVDNFDQKISKIPYITIAVDPNDPSTWSATPRNALCPCDSGKKYKYCHGTFDKRK